MRLHRRTRVTLLAATLLLAACGGDQPTQSKQQVAPPSEPTAVSKPIRLNSGSGSSEPAPKPAIAKQEPVKPVAPAARPRPNADPEGGARLAGLSRAGGNPLAMLTSLTNGQREAAPSAQAGQPTAAPARQRAAQPFSSYRYAIDLTMSFTCGASVQCQESVASGARMGLGEEMVFKLSGAFAGPDRYQARCVFNIAEFAMDHESVAIGDQTWSRSGNEPFTKDYTSACDPRFSPSDFGEALQREQLDMLKLVAQGERVNGVVANRYTVDMDLAQQIREEMGFLAALLAANPDEQRLPGDIPFTMTLDVDLWLMEQDNIPVKATATFRLNVDGAEMALSATYNLTDINSSAVVIAAP